MATHPPYDVADSPAAFEQVAARLLRGRGPFALDTERASAYRYDDRAFLIQVHRRGSGTFLIAPEGHRDDVERILAPVLNGQEWILHAAGEDLPSLAALGLYPGVLFDTELASRLAGFDRPNLAAMVEFFTGVTLAKGHGKEDWSAIPLPPSWRTYAAEDVLYLFALAEGLAEYLDAAGKLEIAEQEFAHLVRSSSDWSRAARRTWRESKGVSALTRPQELQVARAVWTERDERARRSDTAPGSILPNRVLISIARAQPTSSAAAASISGFPRKRRGAAEKWSAVVRRALDESPSTWPTRAPRTTGAPPKKMWEHKDPQAWAALIRARDAVHAAATQLNIQPETVLAASVLRETVWAATRLPCTPDTHSIALELAGHGARPWQVEITAPLIAAALNVPATA
ncbi:HRDC domain-containing protein [Corynebacterium sp. LK2510]|uniref:HRDC domain-containing protein n=1 Tax=Corynebacterium sp. LK2510 TaxID=3110472 RepID=UPI0034CD9207